MLRENLINIYETSFRENYALPALTDYFKQESFTYLEMGAEIAKLHLLFDEAGIRQGDRIALRGANGTGKTSLLRLLCGLMQPTAGEILLQGQPLHTQRHALARNLLWNGHAAGIKGLLTAEENLLWLSALHVTQDREAIWQALAAVGLRGFEDVPCHTLSAGQQRRRQFAQVVHARLATRDHDVPGRKAIQQLEQFCRRCLAIGR